ncbi:phosphate/phosphite/phosphonate ABC transporter substrate-binding protein [Phenylobacterium sp. J426]|uniref:phosphate/phosphite/phosphonate ABC transporter substrate-binding protein n=1 Tax=Phenylobacterium sp. J426 TaxID=2898439 RepID=UPI002150E9EB|nr:phosphate/phosphite/phosphonate ABC transporter substrate-binding protein [Phenylobacterium sp. J426]MCR5874105.1 phosphate/phosphite/phosphonate ABC transporter substrate-binding protein [Phenylobacterium sp. J426]
MIRRSLLGLIAVATLAACSNSEGPAQTKPLNFSILSAESQQSAQAEWEPFLADMSKALGMPVKAYYGSNYTGLIEAMRFKQTDLGWFTNQSGLEAVRRANGEVFARSVNPNGVDGYEAVIVVPKGSGLTLEKLLACDRSINFGIGDAKSTSGTLAPMTYLFAPRGIDPETCFKTVRSANHEANLFAVSSGTVDAATNNTASMERMAMLDTPIAKRTLGSVEIIWRSPRIPEDPLIWRKDLDPALKQKIADFMFSYGVGDTSEAARQRAILERIQTLPFKAADATHLLPVREMEATGELLQARRRGDAAAVAKAEAALAEIRKERAAVEPN